VYSAAALAISINKKMTDYTNYRAGFISISGLPNVGKSTLINALCGTDLSAVSPKPQTTRYHLKGILTTKDYQMIFIDTPGFINPKTKLEKIMHAQALKAVKEDADIVILLIEPDIKKINDKIVFFDSIFKIEIPIIVVINKIDIYGATPISEVKDFLLERYHHGVDLEISAKAKKNIEHLKKIIIDKLPVSPPYYYDEILSDRWERYFAAEKIMEQIFNLYHDEIPYSSAVEIEMFKEDMDPVYILANIYLSKKSHKPIIIGERGRAIGRLRESAEKKIKEFMGRDVKLELFVKIRENWQNDPVFLENLTKDYR
jgi:GTP-binding protein Era